MKPPIIRVSLAFGGAADNTLITFANHVHMLLYSVGDLPTPPLTAAVLLAGIDDFANAKAAQASGGKAATADKNNRRATLVAMLKKLALFVQEASDNNLALLLSTGFEAVSNNRARYPLSKPTIDRIVTGLSGTALVTITTQRVARGCEIRVAEVDATGTPGPFRPVVFSTSSRKIKITDLVPGKLYAYQGRTLGGSTTYSDWSDLIVQRAG